jgi:hypothetical protein
LPPKHGHRAGAWSSYRFSAVRRPNERPTANPDHGAIVGELRGAGEQAATG